MRIFNGRRNGSIRTQRIKLNHQDIPYIVEYQKGSSNQADYMSRRGRDLTTLSPPLQRESHELNNLLYALHSTPIVYHISLAEIARETHTDVVLSRVVEMVRKGSKSADRQDCDKVRKFNPILTELTLTGNGILLKGERIVLPESMKDMAMQLAHMGSYPGRCGIERRLRFHFFFHGMYDKVKKFVQQCKECSLFVDKKTKEPIAHHTVPLKAWETVAIDLFGPMPSSRHVVVVQDIGSRYPAAKLVASTKADKVIPALDEIYSEYGYPDLQISDNGPPFNSHSYRQFTNDHGITTKFSSPYCPNQNPAETFMKTVGKAMKIANHSKVSETRALRDALVTYRQTPHPATSLPPANMLFRDGMKYSFPRRSSSDKELHEARKTDLATKVNRQENVNSSKYRKKSAISPGDVVLARDCTKSKFDPVFLADPFVILNIDENAGRVILEGLQSTKVVVRHLDDVKEFHGNLDLGEDNKPPNVEEASQQDTIESHVDDGDISADQILHVPVEVRRSNRERSTPVRYPEEEWLC